MKQGSHETETDTDTNISDYFPLETFGELDKLEELLEDDVFKKTMVLMHLLLFSLCRVIEEVSGYNVTHAVKSNFHCAVTIALINVINE